MLRKIQVNTIVLCHKYINSSTIIVKYILSLSLLFTDEIINIKKKKKIVIPIDSKI